MKNLDIDLKAEAERFYSNDPPEFKATVKISVEEAAGSIAIDGLLLAFDEAIKKTDDGGVKFARTYGQLKVGTDLSGKPTSVDIVKVTDFDSGIAEIETSTLLPPSSIGTYPDVDSSITYLLSSCETLTELQLIKLLHLVDASIVTSQYQGGVLPVIRTATPEEIIEVRNRSPELLLRSYGNVRKLSFAPSILGIVMPTDLLEKEDIQTGSLPVSVADKSNRELKAFRPLEGMPTSIIGITSAKKPHIGHAFLLAKAFSVNPNVQVELNDRGPRVAMAVNTLAKELGVSIEMAAELVSNGEVTNEAIELAYINRRDGNDVKLPSNFCLKGPNEYYAQLLRTIQPVDGSINSLADSDLVSNIKTLPGFTPLYDGSCGVIADETGAVEVMRAGELTAKGVLGSLAMSLVEPTIVDSPPLFTNPDRRILASKSLKIESASGSALKLDFIDASGTKGNSLQLDRCMEILISGGLDGTFLVPVVRSMMAKTILIQSEFGSLCPNFANLGTVEQRFEEAVTEIASLKEPLKILSPIVTVPASPIFAADLAAKLELEVTKFSGPSGLFALRQLLDKLPVISKVLSQQLTEFILSDAEVLSKDRLSDKDRQLLMGVLQGTPKILAPLLLQQIEADQKFDTGFAAKLISGSKMDEVLRYMGYSTSDEDVIRNIFVPSGKSNLGAYLVK